MVHLAHDGGVGHQPRILNGERGLIGQRGEQRDVALAEFARPVGVAAQHPDRFFAHDERHGQQGDQLFLLNRIDRRGSGRSSSRFSMVIGRFAAMTRSAIGLLKAAKGFDQ